jgi:glycosyltransferase involved in cell wall biosynthesis
LRISVAMCSFNGATYLGSQLDSIAAQTRLPDELIVSDDRSTDESVAVVEKFALEAPFPVDVSVAPRHLGSTRNYERAIQRCSGDIIVLCDQDDVWLPHKLERIERAFGERPEAGLVFSNAYLIDARGRRTGRLWEVAGFPQDQRDRMRHDAFGQLMSRSVVSGCTLAFRTEFRRLLVPFPPQQAAGQMRLIHDRWISIMLALISDVVLIDEPLVEYRIHPRQQVGIPRLQVRRVVPQSVLRFGQVAVPLPVVQDRLRATIGHLSTVRERLLVDDRLPGRDRAIARIDDCIAHLRARGALPRSRPLRLARVLREAATGRYHRYSLGAASVVADLGRSPGDRNDTVPAGSGPG